MAELIETVSYTKSIREIVLSRPDRRNALSVELLDLLCASVQSLEMEPDARVVILRAEGSIFSAGMDLHEAVDESRIKKSSASLERAYRLLNETQLVTIAAVQGGAYAGGAGLMAACDLVVAAEDVQIAFPEVRRGLLPALISRVLHPRVRDGELRDLFLTGEPINAERARQIGLVQRVVPPDTLLESARQIAKSIVLGGPEAVRITKQLLNLQRHESGGPSLEDLHQAARRSDEAREGLKAFLEKRQPAWTQESQEPENQSREAQSDLPGS